MGVAQKSCFWKSIGDLSLTKKSINSLKLNNYNYYAIHKLEHAAALFHKICKSLTLKKNTFFLATAAWLTTLAVIVAAAAWGCLITGVNACDLPLTVRAHLKLDWPLFIIHSYYTMTKLPLCWALAIYQASIKQ